MSASDNIRMLNVKGRQKFPLFQKNSGQHITAILSILHTHTCLANKNMEIIVTINQIATK